MAENGTLLVFTRTPVPGKTKTRLVPALGEQGAVDLYTRFMEHTLEQAVQSNFSNLELWCTEPGNAYITGIENSYPVRVKFQQGKNLGERMFHALYQALQYSDYAVLIGCDCPAITTEILNQSLQILQQDNAVLGPSRDGGYYLIGLRQAVPVLFENIAWGGPDVARETRNKMKVMGWAWAETGLLQDIDTPGDLLQVADFRTG